MLAGFPKKKSRIADSALAVETVVNAADWHCFSYLLGIAFAAFTAAVGLTTAP